MSTSKTSTSELFNRYIWLANTVYAAGRITYEEIARKWRSSYWNNSGSDLPLRTFHDHRKAVEELFDINIACDRHDGFHYFIENTDDIERGNLRKWLLGTMTVSNVLTESKGLRSRILLEEIPSGMNYLTPILDAIRDNRTIEVMHRSFKRDAEYSITLNPYCLKLFHQRWYLLGLNHEIGEARVYALDRFTDCTVTDRGFDMPEGFDGEAFFSDYFGVYVDPSVKVEKVLLRVEGVSCNYLRTLPLHHSQKEVERHDGYSIFEYVIRPTVDFISDLAGRHKSTRVLQPEWLADAVQQEIDK